jgi:hypothetical protein
MRISTSPLRDAEAPQVHLGVTQSHEVTLQTEMKYTVDKGVATFAGASDKTHPSDCR